MPHIVNVVIPPLIEGGVATRRATCRRQVRRGAAAPTDACITDLCGHGATFLGSGRDISDALLHPPSTQLPTTAARQQFHSLVTSAPVLILGVEEGKMMRMNRIAVQRGRKGVLIGVLGGRGSSCACPPRTK